MAGLLSLTNLNNYMCVSIHAAQIQFTMNRGFTPQKTMEPQFQTVGKGDDC